MAGTEGDGTSGRHSGQCGRTIFLMRSGRGSSLLSYKVRPDPACVKEKLLDWDQTVRIRLKYVFVLLLCTSLLFGFGVRPYLKRVATQRQLVEWCTSRGGHPSYSCDNDRISSSDNPRSGLYHYVDVNYLSGLEIISNVKIASTREADELQVLLRNCDKWNVHVWRVYISAPSHTAISPLFERQDVVRYGIR